MGEGTVASTECQLALGRYNEEDRAGQYALIVGNGTADSPSNLFTLDWFGNAWFQEGVTVGYRKKQLATKDPANGEVAGLVKIGDNITLDDSDGTISVTKQNVINALGFTPSSGGGNYLPLSGGEVNGDVIIRDHDIRLKFSDSAKSIHFHQGNSGNPTASIIGTANNSMQLGGGTWGNLCINGADGCFYPITGGNYSLGASSARFYTAWLLNAPNVSSLAELKTDITAFYSALDEVDKTDVYTYKRIDNIERNGDDITHVGFVIGEGFNCSELLKGEGGDGIDLYNGVGLAFGAVKELYELVKTQQKEIAELKAKLGD